MNSSKLIIRDLAFMMSIGVYEQEKLAKQRVLISADVELLAPPKSERDDIADVLSYDDVIRDIEGLCGGGHVHLVERLAEDIANAILNYNQVKSCKVTVEKPDIYENARSVGIEIIRQRLA